jgi:hypothetical protein
LAALAKPVDDPAGDATIVLALPSSVDHRRVRLDRHPRLILEPKIIRPDSGSPDTLEAGARFDSFGDRAQSIFRSLRIGKRL